ncbi:calcium-translocating P-type ATPase, SERCA-type [archaeon]|jgi:P-type Ca2+ transporter type 2C|nr:calcium-translocating P-type ATPase, SERCA-type [archaeon]MBT6868906.1 calcium-translocating P-type ATPase, SERCA-type [archaeon]MBT7192873.1 calcium-translocating P-type ATPase, SERCA-type [archaeon]MBT7380839.1 calcium-translocating P-type ATPase, SERCA-type [archaeon]MBT7507594.1 calcium-translocating P-type ATPase, SERCA-type [archaeon]
MYFDQDVGQIYKDLNSTEAGLKTAQVARKFSKYGYNELKSGKKVSPLKIFLEQFNSPLVWILILALFISIFLHETLDAIVIGLIIVVNASLGFIQEYRAEKSIEALKKMSSLKAKVIRNGKEIKIDSKYLVPGDIIVLETGDKIPADARLIEVHSLKTQEGPLTGESQPITKSSDALKKDTPLADQINMVFSGTVVSEGRAKAVVTYIGMQTEIGKIAKLIEEAHDSYTPLQKKLRELGTFLTIAVVIVATVVFLAGLLTGKEATAMFLTAIALAVAAIPEGLPAVITVSLALGVQKMIKKNVLVRKLPSVETLGSVNVICTDKTGTLTHNQMTVTKIWANEMFYDVEGSGYSAKGSFNVNKKLANPLDLHLLLNCGMLCNDAELGKEKSNGQRDLIGDPTEAALVVSAEKAGFNSKILNKDYQRIDEIPFTSDRKLMTTVHKNNNVKKNKGIVSFTKGAPDILINKCNRILIEGKVYRLNRAKKKEILKINESYAKQALRVLGLAYNDEYSKRINAEKDMIFLGLQAMIDPPREEVKDSIQKCVDAGIRVIMITGDQITTAQAIAKQLGIKGNAMSGTELDKVKNLKKILKDHSIFARVRPEHKLEIVKVLQKEGFVVAMTGDGVNDAPALKKADIGVAMGLSGTDVAKEASDMILTDDNFTSIVNAVEEGRGIFDNIRKFVNYLLSSNLGEIVVILLASLFGMPLPLTAIQILWVNLITDGLPATALSIDPHEKDIMKRKPRNAKESILSKELMWDIIIVGTLIGIGTLILFWLYLGSGLEKAQTIAFNALVLFEVARLQMIRSRYNLGIFSNTWLVLAVVASLILQMIVVYSPLNVIFGVVPLELTDWLMISSFAVGLYLINKVYYYWRDLKVKA